MHYFQPRSLTNVLNLLMAGRSNFKKRVFLSAGWFSPEVFWNLSETGGCPLLGGSSAQTSSGSQTGKVALALTSETNWALTGVSFSRLCSCFPLLEGRICHLNEASHASGSSLLAHCSLSWCSCVLEGLGMFHFSWEECLHQPHSGVCLQVSKCCARLICPLPGVSQSSAWAGKLGHLCPRKKSFGAPWDSAGSTNSSCWLLGSAASLSSLSRYKIYLQERAESGESSSPAQW